MLSEDRLTLAKAFTQRSGVRIIFYGIAIRPFVGSSLLAGGISKLQSVIVRSLTKTWGETTAVDDVSFTVAPGQLMV